MVQIARLLFFVLLLLPTSVAAQSPLDILRDIINEGARSNFRAQQAPRNSHRPSSSVQMSKQDVMRLQGALQALGYYSGTIDGVAGSGTWNSVAAWASDRGWNAPQTLRLAHVEAMENELAQRTHIAAPVQTGDTDWKPLKLGTGTQSCVRKSQYQENCIAVACHYEAGLSFDLRAMPDMYENLPTQATFQVDSGGAVSLALDTLNAHAAIDLSRDAPLIDALANGGAVTVSTSKSSQSFRLGGFAAEFQRVEKQCAALLARLRSGEDPSSGAYGRLVDEATAAPPSFPPDRWITRENIDFSGNDIRHGMSDPLLRGIRNEDCLAICTETDGCNAYTFNPLGGTCFLKSDAQQQSHAPGVTSVAASAGKRGFAPPPTRGAGPVVDGDVGWRQDDTLERHQTRIREAARALGGACDEEQATLAQLVSGFKWTVRKSGQPRAGSPISIDWTGNTLEDRIPVWLVVHAAQTVRFSGTGHIAMGPDAPNPFAIRTGLGQTRALVALATRGSAQNGTVALSPMAAGSLEIGVSVVGYLRACEREVVLTSGVEHIDVVPAPAEIVLNTPEGRAAFTHAVDVKKFARRVLFNETRFLVLDAATGTEVVERAGTGFEISPTHRFISVLHNGRTDIVDLVDGGTVASIAIGELFWGLGDSFVFTGSVPWAKIDLISTFGDHLRVNEQLTGPSCCSASPGATRVGIDIENAAYSIWGNLGYRVGSLQNPAYASMANSFGGYSSEGGEFLPLHLHTYWSLGMVSPVSIARQFDVAGGFFTTPVPDDIYQIEDAKSPEAWAENVTMRLAAVGLTAERIAASASAAARVSDSGLTFAQALPAQLLRMGIALSPMTAGEDLLPTVGPEWNSATEQDQAARKKLQEATLARFEQEARARGWRIAWSPGIGEEVPAAECDHVLLEDTARKGPFTAPREVDQIAHIPGEPGGIWVSRASCTAGATFGSLRPHSAFYIVDLAAQREDHPSAMVEGAFFFENAAHRLWYEHPFSIKADDRHLITLAPGNGVISVRDRSTHKTIWIGNDLPNGDLLVDAWLTEDRGHAVQLNSDGNFYIHNLAGDGDTVLAGRIADDEIAVWTSDHFYDATAEAASLIDLKFPGKMGQYSLDRFGAARWAPELAKRIVFDRTPPSETAELGVPPNLEAEIEVRANGRIAITPRYDTSEVARIAVLQDGVLTDTFNAGDTVGGIEVARLSDARWLSVVATNAAGLVSLPVSIDIGATVKRQSTSRALVIGVNTYESERLRSLNYAMRDAGAIYDVLASPQSGIEPGFKVEFGPKDRRATPDGIVSAVERLLDGLSKGDHAVLFLAGHGLRAEDGRFFFATSQTDVNDLDKTALSFDRLTALFEKSDARITVLLDACHSGAAGGGLFATNDDLANSLSTLRSNVTILSAAKGRQESQGRREVGGLFTHAIATVLAEGRSTYDTNGNGRIEASELYRGVKALVMDASDGTQTPWMITRRMVGEYALF